MTAESLLRGVHGACSVRSVWGEPASTREARSDAVRGLANGVRWA